MPIQSGLGEMGEVPVVEVVVLRRGRALHRSHRVSLLVLGFLVAMAAYSGVQVVAGGGGDGGPEVMRVAADGMRWVWAVLGVLWAGLAVLLVGLELSWLTGGTEVTDRGIVVRSGGRAATVGWVDVEELRAVPVGGGHLYHVRTGVPMPRPPRMGLQGRREAWLGWHPGGDAAVAAVARARIGVKYQGPATP